MNELQDARDTVTVTIYIGGFERKDILWTGPFDISGQGMHFPNIVGIGALAVEVNMPIPPEDIK